MSVSAAANVKMPHFLFAREPLLRHSPNWGKVKGLRFKASTIFYLAVWLVSSRVLQCGGGLRYVWPDEYRQLDRYTAASLQTGGWWIRTRHQVAFSLLSGQTAQDARFPWSITMATDRHVRGVGSPSTPEYSARKGVPSVASRRGEWTRGRVWTFQSFDKRCDKRCLCVNRENCSLINEHMWWYSEVFGNAQQVCAQVSVHVCVCFVDLIVLLHVYLLS